MKYEHKWTLEKLSSLWVCSICERAFLRDDPIGPCNK